MKDLKHTGHTAFACPSCGSLKIKPSGSLSGWMTPAVYTCEQCGYVGRIILEVEPSDDAKNEDRKKGKISG